MDFWRGEAYSKFFDFLDATGGFYYEVCLVFHFSSLPIVTSTALFLFEALGRCAGAYDRCRSVGPQRSNSLLR